MPHIKDLNFSRYADVFFVGIMVLLNEESTKKDHNLNMHVEERLNFQIWCEFSISAFPWYSLTHIDLSAFSLNSG